MLAFTAEASADRKIKYSLTCLSVDGRKRSEGGPLTVAKGRHKIETKPRLFSYGKERPGMKYCSIIIGLDWFCWRGGNITAAPCSELSDR